MTRTYWVIPIALSLAGCTVGGGIQTKRIGFVMPSGWTKAESDDKSVTVGVPPGFKFGVDKMMEGNLFGTDSNSPQGSNQPQLSADDKKFMEQMNSAMHEMSKEEEEAHLDRLKKNGIVLMCTSTGKPTLDEDRTRFYVKRESQNTNWTWEDAAKAQAEKFNGSVKPEMVKLPIGQAYRMEKTWQMQNGAMHTLIVYAIPNGRDLYSLRFITEEPKEVVTRIDHQVADSLRIN